MKKFLFCFPLKTGNLVFGFTILLVALATLSYHAYQISLLQKDVPHKREDRHTNIMIDVLTAMGEYLVHEATLLFIRWYTAYVVIASILFVFALMFTYGVYKENYCLVKTFFVYSIVHLIVTIALIIWEGMTHIWVRFALVLIFGLVFAICLPSVKFMMDAIKFGEMSARPGDVMLKNIVEDDAFERDLFGKERKPLRIEIQP